MIARAFCYNKLMVIGKYLLEILAVLIVLSIVSTLVMYHFGVSYKRRKKN